MNKNFSLATFALTSFLMVASVAPKSCEKEADPAVVSEVDFNRYSGLWYEIAHNPNSFQEDCLRSTAEYQVVNATSVSVHNICYEADKTSDITGTAEVVDPAVPAKLKVTFGVFQRGDYWIIDLDPNYQWAVVSAPAKKSLFILARQAPMDEELLADILQRLKNQGFNTDELIYDQY